MLVWICSAEAAPQRCSYDSKINMFITNIDLFKYRVLEDGIHFLKWIPSSSTQYVQIIWRSLQDLSLSESSPGFNHSFQPSVKIASLGKCKTCPSFYFESKTGKFVMSLCFTGDKKELTLKRIHVTLAGRCFQVWHA